MDCNVMCMSMSLCARLCGCGLNVASKYAVAIYIPIIVNSDFHLYFISLQIECRESIK